MYPNSSDTPSARGQQLVPFKPQDDVLEGVIVDGSQTFQSGGPFRFEPRAYRPQPHRPQQDFPTIEDITQAFSSIATGLTDFFVGLSEGLGKLSAAMAKAGEAAREAGLVPEEPPTDPRARALWMKQHRNTGPAVPKDWRKR